LKLTVTEIGPVVLTLTQVVLEFQLITRLSLPLSHGCCMSAPRRLDAECSALQQLLSGTSCKQVSSICVTLPLTPLLISSTACNHHLYKPYPGVFDVVKQPSRPRQAEWIDPEPLRSRSTASSAEHTTASCQRTNAIPTPQL
jgi:hypothetical protein